MFNFFKKCCGAALAVFMLYFAMGTASAQCAAEPYTITVTVGSYPAEVSWEILSPNGVNLAQGTPGTYTVNLVPAQLTFNGFDSYGDGWNGATATVTRVSTGQVILSTWTFSAGAISSTNLNAGSCVAGCTDATALNYSASANANDGSCSYTCSYLGNYCYPNNLTNFEFLNHNTNIPNSVLTFTAGSISRGTSSNDRLRVYKGTPLDASNLIYDSGAGSSGTTLFPLAGVQVTSPTGQFIATMTSGAAGSCTTPSGTGGTTKPKRIYYNITCGIPGCMNSSACNFSPTATFDNNSCEFISCAGCQDPLAANYSSTATIPSACTYCEVQQPSFCYTPNLSSYQLFSYSSPGTPVTVTFNQGTIESSTWDQLRVYNSTILTAANQIYINPTATTNLANLSITSPTGVIVAVLSSDGSVSCSTASTYVAMQWSVSWDCDAIGCTDESSCNFDANATFDDGSCDYSCIGCMDPGAANYNPNATQENDNSCLYCAAGTFVAVISMTDSGNDGWEGAQYFLSNLSTGAQLSGSFGTGDIISGGVAQDLYCLEMGCYTFAVAGGTGLSEVGYTVSDQFGTDYISGTGGVSNFGIDFGLQGQCNISGCTDPYCFNYNISATVDNGTCICPPPNNALELAEAVFCGLTVNGTLANATDEDNVTNFPGFLTPITTPGVWYEFNATSTQQVIVDLCGTQQPGVVTPVSDTRLHIFRELANGTLQPVVSNNNTCNLHASAAFLAQTGGNYFIYVSKSATTNTGSNFVLSVNCESCAGEVPFNDVCEDAFPQFSGVTFTGSVCCASSPSIPSFNGNATNTNYGVWFTFNSSDYDTFYFDLTNVSAAQLTLTIYTQGGTCLTLPQSLPAPVGSIVGCAFTGQCAGSIETFIDLQPDTDYYFLVGTTDPAGCGDFEFTTTGIYLGCTDPSASNYDQQANQDDGTCTYSQAPANDLCANATTLPCNQGFISGSLGGATADLEIGACSPGGPTQVSPCLNSDSFFSPYPSDVYQLQSCTGLVENITTDGWASEYSLVAVTAGNSYQFSSSIATDIVTVSNESGTVALAYGAGSAEWTADFTGVVRFYTHIADCGFETTSRTRSVACSTTSFAEPGGIWYTFEGTGELTNIYTCGSVLNTTIHVYESVDGSCGNLTCATQLNGNLALSEESFEVCGFFDQDDASVEFISEEGTTYYVYVAASGAQNGSIQIAMDCEPAIYGCQIDAACNYNPNANIDDNSCEYTSCACDNNPGGTGVVIEMFDSFGDGWEGSNAGSPGGYQILTVSGEVVASGQIDDAFYQVDEDNFTGPEFGFDVTCLSDGCYIFRFTGAFQWANEQSWELSVDGVQILAGSPSANSAVEDYPFSVGDAVCGCTAELACNYNPAATDDNGTCEYLTCAGCTDSEACNYDATATIEDNSCNYGFPITISMYDELDGWQGAQLIIRDLSGAIVLQTSLANGFGNEFAQESACLDAGCYTVESTSDTWADEVSWTITGVFGGVIQGGASFPQTYFSVGGNNCIPGCTIECACNYNPNANVANIASCTFDNCAGCTYVDATNYSANASTDDGSCIFDLQNPCPADLNQDGSVTTADLLQFLGAFGTVCQ
jgi:hypothetical protein